MASGRIAMIVSGHAENVATLIGGWYSPGVQGCVPFVDSTSSAATAVPHPLCSITESVICDVASTGRIVRVAVMLGVSR